MSETAPIDQITKEAWSILLDLAQTNDYEFPYRVPLLCDRAAKVIAELDALGAKAED